MSTESQLRADIVEVGRRMYARGYTASNDGNISVRLEGNRLLMTPKNVCKGFMTPDMMCVTDLDGRKLQGDRDPSSEMLMHLEVYRQRPDVKAVVHAHPPTATGFAVGYKPAGGIRTAKQALEYLYLMKEELGNRWLRPDLFRFGASSLLTDIERQLEHFVTGRYSAAHRHPMV